MVIGFVLRNSVVAGVCPGIGAGRMPRVRGLGSFCIAGAPRRAGTMSVYGLGSFRIFLHLPFRVRSLVFGGRRRVAGTPGMNRGKMLLFAPFEICWLPPRLYDPLLNLEAHYTIKTSDNQVIFGRFSRRA